MLERNNPETTESKAAVAIQRFYRRRKTRLNNIPISQSPSSYVFVPPNNPVLLLEKYKVKPREQVVLVGISGFPAVEMSCRLVNDPGHSPVPKIFIIDYNKNVIKFWRAIMAFFYKLPNATPMQFRSQLIDFTNKNKEWFGDEKTTADELANRVKTYTDYIIYLRLAHSHTLLRNIIINATVIRGDWNDENLFLSLKHIFLQLNYKNIYVYAANAATFNFENRTRKILQNIAILKPQIVVHSNYAPYEQTSTLYSLFNYFEVDQVFQNLEHSIQVDTNKMVFSPGTSTLVPAQNYLGILTQELFEALHKLIETQKYDMLSFPHRVDTPFLPFVILRMAGVTAELRGAVFFNSRSYQTTIFHYNLPIELSDYIIDALNKRFPGLNVSYPFLGENISKPGFSLKIAINTVQLKKIVLPQIPDFLVANPEHKTYFEKSLGAGLKEIRRVFINQNVTLEDYASKSLSFVAREHSIKLKPTCQFPKTIDILIYPDQWDFHQALIYLDCSANEAKFFVDYFNSLVPNSVSQQKTPVPFKKQNKSYIELTVKNEALTHPTFLAALRKALVISKLQAPAATSASSLFQPVNPVSQLTQSTSKLKLNTSKGPR